MERHEISTEKIHWPELVRHVACERVVVELSDLQRPIAMLVPIERRKTMAELDVALRLLPRLGVAGPKQRRDASDLARRLNRSVCNA
jgi:antitoxin (DNA-binding transcriptional repressor) of toxin-antitoxin stability system